MRRPRRSETLCRSRENTRLAADHGSTRGTRPVTFHQTATDDYEGSRPT